MNGVFVTQFGKGWPLCLYTGRPKASEASHAIRERLWRALVAEETAVVAQAKFKGESEKNQDDQPSRHDRLHEYMRGLHTSGAHASETRHDRLHDDMTMWSKACLAQTP
jgi:hypothetical protein